MSDETARNPRFRLVTFAIIAETQSEKDEVESRIIHMQEKWNRGIKCFAYAYHDEDEYTEEDEAEAKKKVKESEESRAKLINERALERFKELPKTGCEEDLWLDTLHEVQREVNLEVYNQIPRAGNPKTKHWHVIIDFGNNAKPVDEIAAMMRVPPNLICKIHGGRKGLANMLAYLTHITPDARAKGKHKYAPDIVKGLRFPNEPPYDAFTNYADFARAFENDALQLEMDALMVMSGKITPAELKEKNPKYYLNNIDKIHKARREYVNNLPTPKVLSNFYIGALSYAESGSHQKGRIGKGLMANLLAISHLMQMYPDVDFMSMDEDDLKARHYVFHAGSDKVTFDGYDGEPIIIWDDIRSDQLIKVFGGVDRVFDALDTHPKPVAVHVKFDHVYLKNCINIFCGTETYVEFITGLSMREVSYGKGSVVLQEDSAQAMGRFPYIVQISPDFIVAEAQLQYLIGTDRYNFRRRFENNLLSVMQHGMLYQYTEQLGRPFLDAEAIACDSKQFAQALPNAPFREITEDEMKSRVEQKRREAEMCAKRNEVYAKGYEILAKAEYAMVQFYNGAWGEDIVCKEIFGNQYQAFLKLASDIEKLNSNDSISDAETVVFRDDVIEEMNDQFVIMHDEIRMITEERKRKETDGNDEQREA